MQEGWTDVSAVTLPLLPCSDFLINTLAATVLIYLFSARTGGKLQEKPETAWLADLTKVMGSDNEAFTSCSRDIQIVTSLVIDN